MASIETIVMVCVLVGSIVYGAIVFTARPARLVQRIPVRARTISVMVLYLAVVVEVSYGLGVALAGVLSVLPKIPVKIGFAPAQAAIQQIPSIAVTVLVSLIVALVISRVMTHNPAYPRVEEFINAG